MSKCTGCGRAIVWALSPKGAWILLEHVKAVYHLSHNYDDPETPQAEKLNDQDGSFDPFYISHFLTCPKASEFSGRTRRT